MKQRGFKDSLRELKHGCELMRLSYLVKVKVKSKKLIYSKENLTLIGKGTKPF